MLSTTIVTIVKFAFRLRFRFFFLFADFCKEVFKLSFEHVFWSGRWWAASKMSALKRMVKNNFGSCKIRAWRKIEQSPRKATFRQNRSRYCFCFDLALIRENPRSRRNCARESCPVIIYRSTRSRWQLACDANDCWSLGRNSSFKKNSGWQWMFSQNWSRLF